MPETARVHEATRLEGTDMHAVRLPCLGLGNRARRYGASTGTDVARAGPAHPLCWRDACLTGCPSFKAWSRGADEVPKHVTQYKNSLCAGKVFKARWHKQAGTNDNKTYLVNSLTAIDPPSRKILDYYVQGRQVFFEPPGQYHHPTISRRVLLRHTLLSQTRNQPNSLVGYSFAPPKKKKQPPPTPIPAIGVHPALKYSPTACSPQPTAALHTSPRPKPRA